VNKPNTITAFFALTAALLLSFLAASVAEDRPAATPAPAIELGAPFIDNAILQREMPARRSGFAYPSQMDGARVETYKTVGDTKLNIIFFTANDMNYDSSGVYIGPIVDPTPKPGAKAKPSTAGKEE
jgi:hypothetical protein